MAAPTADQILTYIQIARLLIADGIVIVGKFKTLLSAFLPGHGLTDAQINAIEQQAMTDDDRRIAERIAMSQPG